MTPIRRLWRGELALGHAFWNWAVSGGLAVNLATSALFLFLMMNGHPIAALIAGYGPSIPYNIIVTVGVWRSAGNYQGDRRRADLARAATIVGMVLLGVT